MVGADGATAAIVPADWRPELQRLTALFSEHRGQVSSLSASSSTPCASGGLVEATNELMVDTSTRHNAVTNAQAIFTGTIRSITPGFFERTPGSLIELGAVEKVKADARFSDVGDHLYVRLPHAQFTVAGVEYCQESRPAYIPTVGDRLVVFAFRGPGDESGTFLYTTASDVIAQSADGAIRIPKALAAFEGSDVTLATIVSFIRSDINGPRAPRGGHGPDVRHRGNPK